MMPKTQLAISAAIFAMGFALASCDKKADAPQPLNCVASDGSAVPCPSGAGGGHQDPGPVPQHS